ncbi:MAG: hypothetical protein AB1750_19685 [Chloroflexota bacterium]
MEQAIGKIRFMDMKTRLALLLLILPGLACNLPASASTPQPEPTVSWTIYPTLATTPSFMPTASGIPSFAPTLTPLPTFATPPLGVSVRGRVTLNGAGLAGVTIYRKFSAYPNVAIAVTDANGDYQAFIGIPSDEMTSIIPELAGYIFDPPFYYWRHYHGYEERTFDFAALPTP